MKIPALLTTVWVIFSARSSLILLYDVNCHRLQLGAGPPVVARMAMHLAKIKRNLHILFAKDRNGIRGGKNTYSDRTRTSNGGKVVFAFLSNPPDWYTAAASCHRSLIGHCIPPSLSSRDIQWKKLKGCYPVGLFWPGRGPAHFLVLGLHHSQGRISTQSTTKPHTVVKDSERRRATQLFKSSGKEK